MLESRIEKTVSKYAESLGWLAYKWSSPSMRGVMDRVFMYSGRVVFVEFKQKGKPLRKLQTHHMNLITAQSVEVYVVDDVYQGKILIDRITNEQDNRYNRGSIR